MKNSHLLRTICDNNFALFAITFRAVFKKQSVNWVVALFIGLTSSMLMLAPATAAIYADVLVDHSPPDDVDFLPSDILGAPDTLVAHFGNPDSVTPGFATVQFSGVSIIDGIGADLLVHLMDWTSVENEVFEVFGSLDGLSFESLGGSGSPAGGAGALASVGFDLLGSGLDSINYVKIVNLTITATCCEGPDIDSIEAVNTIPIPSAVWLFVSGFLGLVGIARRNKAA